MIRNIIFDFGGVIYDIDHNLSKLAFENLGVENFNQLYGHQIQTEIFEKFETGSISKEAFLNYLKQFLPAKTNLNEIEDAWCALLLGYDSRKIELLKALKKNYQLFLLSNTNIIHYERFIEELNQYCDFRSLFNDTWLSFEKGYRKPDLIFYQSLINKYKLKPEETLFIDDLEKNIDAANKLGIQSYFLNNENILDLFENAVWIKN